MKTILFFAIIIVSSITCLAQEKSFYSFSAGANTSSIEHVKSDFSKTLGYYIGANTWGKFNDYFGYGGSLQIVKQHNKIQSIKENTVSINPSFYAMIFPAKIFNVYGGFQLEFIGRAAVNKEKLSGYDVAHAYYIAGANVDITKRFQLNGRYDHTLYSGAFFTWSVQFGVSYKLKSED